VIERIDIYQQVEGLEFLQQLEAKKLFAAAAPSSEPEAEPESPAARRARVESMNPVQQQELRHRQERFAELQPAQRDELRRLHAELTRTENRRLAEVAGAYAEWFESLSPDLQTDLLDKQLADRVSAIQRFRPPLERQDYARIARWMQDLAWEQRESLRPHYPRGYEELEKKAGVPARRFVLAMVLLGRWHAAGSDGAGSQLQAAVEQFFQLQGELSERARLEMEESRQRGEQRQLVFHWVPSALFKSLDTEPAEVRRDVERALRIGPRWSEGPPDGKRMRPPNWRWWMQDGAGGPPPGRGEGLRGPRGGERREGPSDPPPAAEAPPQPPAAAAG
jgi:hypothetical protein